MCESWVLLRAVSRRGKSLASVLVCSVFPCEASGDTGLSGWVWLWEGGGGQMAKRGGLLNTDPFGSVLIAGLFKY